MARLNDDNQRKLHGSASLERVAVKDGLRLARQGLTQALLLARLLGSGLGLAAVQPVLPILLIGSTLAAAQAQQETTPEPLDKVVIRQLRQTTEGGQSQLLLLIEFDEVDNADTYELQIREKMKGEPAEGQAWSGPDLRSRQLESHGEHKLSPSFPSGVYEVRVQAVPENGSSQYQRGPWSEIREFQLGPETVKDLEVTAGNKSLKVTWKAANYAQNGYRVRWREKGVGALLGKETVTGTSFTIPDLTNGTSYVVRVDTRNNGNGDDVPGTGITECCFEPTEADNHEPIVENEITDPMATTVGMDFNYMFPADTFSDPDKNTLTYSATKSDGSPLPSWLNFNPTTRTFSGTPPAWDPGTLMVKVTASDGLDSVYDIFGIRVRPLTITNITITSIDTQDIIFGEPRDVDVDATAANAGNTLQFKAESSDETVATVTPTALMDHGGSSQITVTPVGIGTATITVTVSDRLLNDAAQTTFMVNVSAAPLATPEVTLNSVGETQLEATWNAVPDAATYELQWKLTTTLEWGVNSVEARPDESIINRFVLEDRLTDNQAYDVRVRAKAATDSTTHQDSAWSESVTGTPVAQALNYMRVQALTVDTEITTLMPAPRGFTNTITYAASPNLPAGLTLNLTTGAISGTPTTVNPDAVTVTVTGTADGGQMATVQIRFPRVNPQPNEIDLTVIPASVVENAPPTTITVTAMVDGTAFPQDQIVTVMVGGQSDDATEGTDYTAVDDFTITIDAGQSSGFETFTLTPIDDRDDETDEMIMLSGTASSGATVRGINLTINDDDGTPTAPTNLSFGAQKYRQLTVRWNAPDDDGGSVITDYDVRYKLTTDSSWTLLDDTMPSTETTATIMNLMNGMQYEVQVRAENMNGSGEWSLSTTATAMGAPASPAMPRLEPGSGYRQLKVSWDAPDDGGSAITDYDVRYKLTTDSSWTLLDDTMPSTETTATIMNLMNGMQYEVQVRAENMNGSGEWSLSTTATAMGAPASPAMPRLEPGSGYRQLKVSWDAPDDGGSAITDYDVRYKLTTDSSWTLLDDTMPSTETTATIMNLMNGMQYEVQVRAENMNGSGEWSLSTTATAMGAPASPAMPRLEPGSGYRQLKVSWDAPDDGGSAITDYDVRYKLTTDSSWTLLDDTMPSAETTATIMNLMNGMQYEVQVRAENMNGSGEWSLSTTATAMGAPASPAMPRLKAGDRKLTVSWDTPDDGGSEIMDYDVRYKLTTDSSWTLLDDTMPSTETTATIMNLMNGMEYEVQVRAENTNGSGEWSLSAMETPVLTKEKLDEVNEEILPSVLNQVTEKQIAIVTDRLATISSDSHMGSLSMEEVVTDVADYLLSHHQDIQANGFDWRQALSGNNFSFALADASVSQGSMDMDDGKHSHNSGSSPVSFWGGIDYSSLEDKIEGFDLHGDIIYFNFGVDKEFTPDLVAGVLLSISNSEFDLTQGPAENTYEVDISTVNPYISWEASDDLSLWASVGYGRGQADLTDDSTDTTVSQSGDFTSFSAGGRFQLWQSEAGTALALKLDGTTAHFLDVDVQNSRLAAELSHDFSIESGVLNTALELGLLMSSADESAAELAGRLHWQGDAGFSASAQSRVLLGGGDRQEWGIGGALHYTTAGAGEGLMMSLEPSLGISNPQLLPGLWSATRSGDLAIATEAPTARLNAAIAYGFPTSDGLLTPYTDFSLSETTNTYTAGLRYGLPTGLDLDLKGMRKTSTTDDGENSILLELGSDL